jgi:hypothetical protein
MERSRVGLRRDRLGTILTVILCRLLYGWGIPLQALGSHHEADLYRRSQPEEEGFFNGREVRRIVHVDDEVTASGAVHVGEVRVFALLSLDDSAHILGWVRMTAL